MKNTNKRGIQEISIEEAKDCNGGDIIDTIAKGISGVKRGIEVLIEKTTSLINKI